MSCPWVFVSGVPLRKTTELIDDNSYHLLSLLMTVAVVHRDPPVYASSHVIFTPPHKVGITISISRRRLHFFFFFGRDTQHVGS